MVYDSQNGRLYKLGFHNRRDDLEKGFPRKDDRTLGNRIDVAGKPEAAQVLQEILVKQLQASQIIDIFFLKGQVSDIVDDLVEAGCDGEAAAGGILPVKDVEDYSFIVLVFEITLHHGQFVEVRQQSQPHGTHNIHALLYKYSRREPGNLPVPSAVLTVMFQLRVAYLHKNNKRKRQFFAFFIIHLFPVLKNYLK